MTRLRILLAISTVLTALVATVPAVAQPGGDLVYECGSPAAFTSPVGFHGSWGRLRGISYFPALGNHDVCEGGPGSPTWRSYFADQLADLPCMRLNPPCRPHLGYYDRDLDVDSDGRPDWYVLVLDSDCERFNGSTGDTQTASCADGSPQHEWLKVAMGRRHGGATSDRSAPSPSGITNAGGPRPSVTTAPPTSSS